MNFEIGTTNEVSNCVDSKTLKKCSWGTVPKREIERIWIKGLGRQLTIEHSCTKSKCIHLLTNTFDCV